MVGLTLTKKIHSIIELQKQDGFILTGLYLTSEEIGSLSKEVGADEPPTSAVGRYRTIPVFTGSVAGSFGAVSVHKLTGIQSFFAKTDIVN